MGIPQQLPLPALLTLIAARCTRAPLPAGKPRCRLLDSAQLLLQVYAPGCCAGSSGSSSSSGGGGLGGQIKQFIEEVAQEVADSDSDDEDDEEAGSGVYMYGAVLLVLQGDVTIDPIISQGYRQVRGWGPLLLGCAHSGQRMSEAADETQCRGDSSAMLPAVRSILSDTSSMQPQVALPPATLHPHHLPAKPTTAANQSAISHHHPSPRRWATACGA